MVALLDSDNLSDIGWFRHENKDAQTKGFMVTIELLNSEQIAFTRTKAYVCLPACVMLNGQ